MRSIRHIVCGVLAASLGWAGAALAGPATVPAPVPVAIPGGAEVLRVQAGPEFWRVAGLGRGGLLNLRSGPSTSYRVVARVSDGQVLRNLGCTRSGSSVWCRVGLDRGATAWASGRYLEEAGRGGGRRDDRDGRWDDRRDDRDGRWDDRRDDRDGRRDDRDGRRDDRRGDYRDPILRERRNGDLEVLIGRDCLAIYSSRGRRLSQARDCSERQLSEADQAVQRYVRDEAGRPGWGGRPGDGRPGDGRPGRDRPGDDRPGNDRPGNDRPGNDRPGNDRPREERPRNEGGPSFNLYGDGDMAGNRVAAGMIGKDGRYILTVSAERATCSGRLAEAPNASTRQSFRMECSDGDAGQAVWTQSAPGTYTVTLNISGGKVGTLVLR